MHLLLVLFASFAVCSGMRRKAASFDNAASSNSATALITPTLPEQLETVKIRVSYADDENVPGHVFVVIGDYEFDLLEAFSRRRKL
ncbi:hypothetical protein niasHS_000213 [Heterodera schachtii]|uniref:Uncharacterized protein n=2 Tax=Heterodera TaxID=34509 RepID=A0ABD2KB87_HETSC